MITIIDTIFPILAVLIVFLTPKGCNRTINTVLACLLIFIFGLEEFVSSDFAVSSGVIDGAWYDVILVGIYSLIAWLFYRVGGYVQSVLTSIGLVLHLFYLLLWTANYMPMELFYSEVFISLTVAQLMVATNGILRPILYRMISRGGHGRDNRSGAHGSGCHSANRNKI